jgi:5-formyltetrahydrofolate cyclo-ligase
LSGKRVLREAVLADRAALPPQARAEADAALVAAVCQVIAGASRVAGYVPLPDEPGGPGLPAALAAVLPAGGALLLPALTPDRDLDWAAYDGTLSAGATLPLVREPVGPRLGPDAIATAEIILVPALAVDSVGTRLGRGGGSYDRALARVRREVPVIALVYSDELVPVLPAEPHDRPVTAVLTPTGLVRVGPRVT